MIVDLQSPRYPGQSEVTSRRLPGPGPAFSDSGVQAPVMFSHHEPVASWHVVDTHGELHHHPIQRQKDVQHLIDVALSGDFAQFAPFPFAGLSHSVHWN